MIAPPDLIRAVVVDDEDLARARLVRLLQQAGGVVVTGQANSGESALRLLARLEADVVFLDIGMPGVDGMALAQRHAAALPRVVFCTAHDAYAVRAFEVNAVDYLLKPVRPERLALALARLRGTPAPTGAQVEASLTAVSPPSSRVVSHRAGVVSFFDARVVTRFWSSEKYTVFLAGGAEHLSDEPLAALEARLEPHGFVRVHRGELVRLDAVVRFLADEQGGALMLSDGQAVRVSRRNLAEVRARLGV